MNKHYFAISGLCLLSLATPLAISSSSSVIPALAEEEYTNKVVLRVKNMGDYIYVQEEPEDAIDLIHQFENWMRDNTKYKNVVVSYETTDTNETLLTEMQTGKSSYDLVCPSDYMIQKMIKEDLIVPLNRANRDELLANYDQYASKYVRSQLDNIEATHINSSGQSETVKLGDYTVGYMWGTLGLLFNPEYANYNERQIVEDMTSWDVLWNQDYNGTISIKDSMRDTYAAALMHVYKDELEGFRTRLSSDPTYTTAQYTSDIQKIFDRVSDEDIAKVKASLEELKNNIFGLEVDSGKMDIVQKRIGINLAWSGDAVYSMELGENENINLLYAIPLEGSNVWFDGWVMPNNPRSDAQEEVAYYFLDFLSMPENAAQNMEYTGYTSFIGGEDILNLTRDWYDIRTEVAEEEGIEFADVTILEDWDAVDLNYIFNETFNTDAYVPNDDYIFYYDGYFHTVEGEEEYSNISVGGDFFCQYPDFDTLVRCAVMKDYGEQNEKVVKMWEKFKTSAMPLWTIIVLIIEIGTGASLFLFFLINKHIKLKLRAKRKLQRQKN